ncbi:MAG: FIST C-terminal domain-containing protein [bacterium]|nr:FIST C-terminal domain-containing protein [bacterium]
MIFAGEGYSNSETTLEAVREAVGQAMERAEVEAADLVLLFATYHHASDLNGMLETAVEVSGTEAVVGCSGMGVLTSALENDREPGVAVLALAGEELEAVPFLVQGEGAAMEIGEKILPYAGDDAVLVLMPGLFYQPGELIAQIEQAVDGIQVVGAIASGDPGAQGYPRTFQWCGTSVAEEGVAGVLLKGARVMIGVAQGCQPFGQAYAVTRAEKNVIYELAFSPAVDALKEAMDTLTAEEKEHLGRNIFVGLAMDEYAIERGRGDFLIRNIRAIDPNNGAIAVGEQVSVGQTVQFNRRTPSAAHEDIEQVAEQLAKTLPGQKFGLYFNCVARGFMLYGQPDHDVSVIRKHLGIFPMVGFFGNSEFAPVGGTNFMHSYTGVLVLFSAA